ncbi:Clr5 domain-containing protein [Lophiotrema nucula]|uniref:Clr5 domain-containing protein n=1 Tax=Lophiotrema nucula TaxID=690887 RepID=A0A6A5Z2T8_9PLEO|nr:Clr5 domain-containing protein [Lophiotrema nucula]
MSEATTFMVPKPMQPRQVLSESLWEQYKDTISRLYESHKLKEVMKIMQLEHGFRPTIKQYKTQIGKWSLDKKRIKAHEYKAILRKKRQREESGTKKAPTFLLHGQEVPASKIARFENRMLQRGKITDEDTSSDIATPQSLVCLTPAASGSCASPSLRLTATSSSPVADSAPIRESLAPRGSLPDSATTDIVTNFNTPAFSDNVDMGFVSGNVGKTSAKARLDHVLFGNRSTTSPIFTSSPALLQIVLDTPSTVVPTVDSRRMRNPPISPFERSSFWKGGVGLTSMGPPSPPKHFVIGGATGAFGEESNDDKDAWIHEQVVTTCNSSTRGCFPLPRSDARGRDCIYHPRLCRLLKARTLILDLFDNREMTFRQLAKIFAKELLYSLAFLESADVIEVDVILWNSTLQTNSDTASFEEQVRYGRWTLSSKLLLPSLSDERKTLQISRDFSAGDLYPIMHSIRDWVKYNGGVPVGEIGYHVVARDWGPEQVRLTPWMARYH